MKIYTLEFVSKQNGSAERIWHTNRRALERYSTALDQSRFLVHGIRTFEMPMPLTEARMVAFLNTNCAGFLPPDATEHAGNRERRSGAVGSA